MSGLLQTRLVRIKKVVLVKIGGEKRKKRDRSAYVYFRRFEDGFLEERVHSCFFKRVRETAS